MEVLYDFGYKNDLTKFKTPFQHFTVKNCVVFCSYHFTFEQIVNTAL